MKEIKWILLNSMTHELGHVMMYWEDYNKDLPVRAYSKIGETGKGIERSWIVWMVNSEEQKKYQLPKYQMRMSLAGVAGNALMGKLENLDCDIDEFIWRVLNLGDKDGNWIETDGDFYKFAKAKWNKGPNKVTKRNKKYMMGYIKTLMEELEKKGFEKYYRAMKKKVMKLDYSRMAGGKQLSILIEKVGK